MRRAAALAALAALALAACGGGGGDGEEPSRRPNVLWIVWDTVRADHLSLYGYGKETTPFLEAFARDALVFEDCRSVASSTVPAHGSMFTGLLPSEHGADNRTRLLDGRFDTVAELFRGAGYATYLYSANPNLQARAGFDQGFEVEEHPWDGERRARALGILARKTEGDRASGLARILARGDVDEVHLKACGELANEAFAAFLARSDAERPFFAFLNYMEAHEPLVPPRALRGRFLGPVEVERSYAEDRSWRSGWEYSYGQRSFPRGYFEVLSGVYDAALAELDALLADLLRRLEESGRADDTIVVITSDHGEHLGEHGLLGHRYSLYEDLLRVPLVIRAPGLLAPGRSRAPVQNADLFATLLALAGVEAPADLPRRSLDLRSVTAHRARLAEYPADFPIYLPADDARASNFDGARWLRTLRAFEQDGEKLIWASDGTHELYRLREDPREQHDLARDDGAALARALARLEAAVADLRAFTPAVARTGEELLDLGY